MLVTKTISPNKTHVRCGQIVIGGTPLTSLGKSEPQVRGQRCLC